mgnify:CR=1 FL=1
MDGHYLIGTRSPIVGDMEETIARTERTLVGLISVTGPSRAINSHKLIALDDLGMSAKGYPYLACAFSPKRRAELAALANSAGLIPANALIDPSSSVAQSARLGNGVYINAMVSIGANAFLGDFVFVNRSSSIGHHCLIGDYVSIAPGAVLAGNSRVGAHSVIGVGAVVFPDVNIGEKCIISGGSVVRKHVPDGTLVSGNPGVAKKYNTSRSLFDRTDQE